MVKELIAGSASNKDTLLYFIDEMRFGLISNYRRSWSKIGKRAVVRNQMEFSSRYLYSAINPIIGDSVHLIGFKKIDAKTTYKFLEELRKSNPNKRLIVIWDNAPFHRLKAFKKIKDMFIIYLPSYSPNLNPVERFFGELRKITANRIFTDVDKQQALIVDKLNYYLKKPKAIKKLSSYPWIMEQWESVS